MLNRRRATLMLVFCTVLWGFAFIAQKLAMTHMEPLTFGAMRCFLGGGLILPFALREYRRRNADLTPRSWGLIGLMSVAFFFGTWMQQTGLLNTTATNGGFLTGLYVMFVPLILVLFGIRPHPIIWICVPLALLGMFLLNGGGFGSFNPGDGLIVSSAIIWAVHVLLLGHLARSTGLPVFVSSISFLLTGVLCAGSALALEHPTLAGIGAGWVSILYVGVLSTAVAFTLQAIAQQYVPPANAAVILSGESLFAALGGAVILGERLPPIGYFGAALMFIAIVSVETVPALRARRRVFVPTG